MNAASFEQRLAWARSQDAADPLKAFRSRFSLPRGADGRELIYLCGHSLGLAPSDARQIVDRELERWERLGAAGHEPGEHGEHGEPGWIAYAEALQPPLSQISGAHSHEVIAMNSLSVNLHLLL